MEEKYLKSLKIGFIGGGNMASAIGAGLIHKGMLSLSLLISYNISKG